VIIVQCPNCSSRFRFGPTDEMRTHYTMRCSVCRHVFEYTVEQEMSIDEEFDMLVRSAGAEHPAEHPVEPTTEQAAVGEEADTGLAEALQDEEATEQAPSSTKAEDVPAESVMREIDSILGASDEAEAGTVEELPAEAGRRMGRIWIAAAAVCLIVIIAAMLWVFRERIYSLTGTGGVPAPQAQGHGPLFTIGEGDVACELLTHEREGSVLVIRGTLKKITQRPVESVLVEARVYDREHHLMESRIAYAGIVPDTSEFMRQPRADIDALLTAEPVTPGSTLPVGDIPFAVAFFGKAAREGASFQVEVKEIHWKE
jgi:hypothetical protein